MESYTFRCENEYCDEYRKTIDGITMGHVMDAGMPICQDCGDELELVGPDDGADARDAREQGGKVTTIPVTRPTAYGPVPGPPVNPSDAAPRTV